jgi:hypothetical protein
MNWIAISAIGDILAAAGMIGSLLFVGIQIQRDRKASEYQAITQRQTGAREAWSVIAASDGLASAMAKMMKNDLLPTQQLLVDKYGLEPDEAVRIDAIFTVFARQGTSILQMPMSETERLNVEKSLVDGLTNNKSFGAWWEAGKRTLPAEIVTDIDRMLQQAAN